MAKAERSPMAEAWKLFDEGDKVAARRVAKQVLASDSSAEDKAGAQDLLHRLQTPKIAYAFAALAAAVALLLSLLAHSYH